MEYIHKLIAERRLFIKEAEKFKELLANNLGKTINKRQLGRTAVPYYSDKNGPTFKFYLNEARGYLTHHIPPIQEDLEQVDRDISYQRQSIKRLQYLLDNRTEMIEKRKQVILKQKEFEDALNQLMSDTCDIQEYASNYYVDYFGISYREITPFSHTY